MLVQAPDMALISPCRLKSKKWLLRSIRTTVISIFLFILIINEGKTYIMFPTHSGEFYNLFQNRYICMYLYFDFVED